MKSFSRRGILAATAPGADQFPSFQDPPPTDINSRAQFCAAFNSAHKRIQIGGWTRRVTQVDFAISETVSGGAARANGCSRGSIGSGNGPQQSILS